MEGGKRCTRRRTTHLWVVLHELLQPFKRLVDLVVGDVVDVLAASDTGGEGRAEQAVAVHHDLVAGALVPEGGWEGIERIRVGFHPGADWVRGQRRSLAVWRGWRVRRNHGEGRFESGLVGGSKIPKAHQHNTPPPLA